MATIDDLFEGSLALTRTPFEHSWRVDVLDARREAWRGTGLLLFTGTTVDQVTRNPRRVTIAFVAPPQVRRLPDWPERWRPSLSHARALVYSSSPWYRYAFQYPNLRRGAHYGPVRPFVVKGTGRPVNPRGLPGLDKHLIAFVRELRRARQVTD